jgi:hypothetical protein
MKPTSDKKPISPKKKRVIFAVIIAICFIAALPAYIGFWFLRNWYDEKIIDHKFHQDITQYPNVKVTKFMLWEGDSMVTIEIPKKGTVRFWYATDQVPRIDAIGKYETSFDCFNIDSEGNKKYVYSTGLWLSNSNPYTKWFSFTVETIGDLIAHYNDIIKVLDTFPKNPKTVDVHFSGGEREMLVKSNPDFILKPEGKNSPVCDLYFKDYANFF